MAVKIETSLLGIPIFRRKFSKHGESFRGWRAGIIDGTHMEQVGPDTAAAYMLWLGGGLTFAENVDGPDLKDFVKEHWVKRGIIFRHKPVWRPSKQSKERGYVIHPIVGQLKESVERLSEKNHDKEHNHEELFMAVEAVVNDLVRLGEATGGQVPFGDRIMRSPFRNWERQSLYISKNVRKCEDFQETEIRLVERNAYVVLHGRDNPDNTTHIDDMYVRYEIPKRTEDAYRSSDASMSEARSVALKVCHWGYEICKSGPEVTEQIVQRELPEAA